MTILPFPYAHERVVGAWPHDTSPPLPDVEPIDPQPVSDLDTASGVAIACAVGLAFMVGSVFGGWLVMLLGAPR